MYCVLDVFSSSSVLSHLFIQEMYQESWRIYFLLVSNTKYGAGGKKSEDYNMGIILVIEHSTVI